MFSRFVRLCCDLLCGRWRWATNDRTCNDGCCDVERQRFLRSVRHHEHMAIKMAFGTELRHSLSVKHVSKFRLTDHVGCGLTIPCLDGVSVMSFRLFFTVLWPLHNLRCARDWVWQQQNRDWLRRLQHYAHAHVFPKCVKSLHTLLGFVLCFVFILCFVSSVVFLSLTNMHRVHRESGEERPEPIHFYQYQRWHLSSSSSSTSWWQWNHDWWTHILKIVCYFWARERAASKNRETCFVAYSSRNSEWNFWQFFQKLL